MPSLTGSQADWPDLPLLAPAFPSDLPSTGLAAKAATSAAEFAAWPGPLAGSLADGAGAPSLRAEPAPEALAAAAFEPPPPEGFGRLLTPLGGIATRVGMRLFGRISTPTERVGKV